MTIRWSIQALPGSVPATGRVLVVDLGGDDAPPPVEGEIARVSAGPARGLRPGAVPCFSLEDLARGRLPRVDEVVLHPLERADLGTLVRAVRAGARRAHLVHSAGACLSLPWPLALGLVALVRGAGRLGTAPTIGRLLRDHARLELAPPPRSVRATGRAFRAALPRGRRRPPVAAAPAGGPLHVVHYLDGLGYGGAERQLTLLVRGTVAAGHRVTILTAKTLEGSLTGHYASEVRAAGAVARALERHRYLRPVPPDFTAAGTRWSPALRQAVVAHGGARELLPLLTALDGERPDVLHCWLDHSNAVGGLAGAAVGIPRIVLSTRTVNPSQYPRFSRRWYRPSYRYLTRLRGVAHVNNSQAGANDYAAWAGMDPGAIDVIYNGVAIRETAPWSEEARRAARVRHGLPPDAFVVVGIFRLAPEKRPADFLTVLARARSSIPDLRAVHVGTGPRAERRAFARRAEALGLADVLVHAGLQEDPGDHLRIADVGLLTSSQEGTPNVSLESQALGVPMVLTYAGGSAETVSEGQTGFACPVGDVDALAARLVELAGDPDRRRAMGERAPTWVGERFGVERMVRETLALYEGGLDSSGAGAAPPT